MADLPSFLTIQRADKTKGHWELTNGWWCPAPSDCNDNTANCYIITFKNGQPFFHGDGTSLVRQFWPDGDIPLVSKLNQAGQAQSDFQMSATWDPARAPQGPYGVYVEGKNLSDVVSGLGERLNGHEQFWLVFEWAEGAIQPPPPPSRVLTEDDVRRIVRDEIRKMVCQ